MVSGASSAKRGVYLGRIEKVRGQRVAVRLAAPIQRGDGVVFEGDRSRGEEIGGRVYEVFRDGRSLEGPVAAGLAELAFRHGTIDPDRLSAGQKLWKTDEPQLRRRLQKTYAAGRYGRRVPVDIVVEAAVGRPLVVSGHRRNRRRQPRFVARRPAGSREAPADGGNAHRAIRPAGKHAFRASPAGGETRRPADVPLERAGDRARHEMVEQLQAAASQPPQRVSGRRLGVGIAARRGIRSSVVSGQWSVADSLAACPADRSHLHVLCRRPEQIAAALRCGVSSVIADFQDLARESRCGPGGPRRGAAILLATPRIHKPQALRISFSVWPTNSPTGCWCGTWPAWASAAATGCRRWPISRSMRSTILSFAWLCRQGACRVTAAYDLNVPRLLDLASAIEPGRLEVVVDWHIAALPHGVLPCARGDTSSLGSTSSLGGTSLAPAKGVAFRVARLLRVARPSPSEGRGVPGGTSSLGGTSLSPSEGRGLPGGAPGWHHLCSPPARGLRTRPHAVGQGSGRAPHPVDALPSERDLAAG